MSVIAWDGTSLAADRRATMGGWFCTVQKIFRSRGALCGYAGDADAGEEVLAWFGAGAVPADFPAAQRDRERFAGLLVVWPSGVIWKYECTPFPLRFPPQHFAIGSGRDFALAAMRCGLPAEQAVGVACEFDAGCGNGVDVLRHEINQPKD